LLHWLEQKKSRINNNLSILFKEDYLIVTIWLNDWKGFSVEQIENLFGLSRGELSSINLLLASYSHSDDSSYAFLLFYLDDCLYEVNASHDSEIDFNGQWQPEETSDEALRFRLTRGNLGSKEASNNIFADELKAILNSRLQ